MVIVCSPGSSSCSCFASPLVLRHSLSRYSPFQNSFTAVNLCLFCGIVSIITFGLESLARWSKRVETKLFLFIHNRQAGIDENAFLRTLAKINEEKMLQPFSDVVSSLQSVTLRRRNGTKTMTAKIKSQNRIPATPAPAPAPAAPAPAAAPADTVPDTAPSAQSVSDARAILQLVAAADTAAAAVRLAERAELVVRAAMDGETRLDFKSACSSLAASLGRETLTSAHVAAVRLAEQTVLRERTATFSTQRIVRITAGRVNVAAGELRTGVIYARVATSPELIARIGEEIAALESRAKLATGEVYYRILGRIAAHRARLADISA